MNIALALLTALPLYQDTDTFDGRWSTTAGPMTLKVEETTLQGTYGWENENEISGTIKAGTAHISWKTANGASGEGELTLWEDGDTFSGFWRSGERKDDWSGYRIAPLQAEPKPGVVTTGQAKSFLNYHLHVPKGYSSKKRYPAIAFFHGSNMSSRPYIETFSTRWPDIAKRYIIVGFDGERLSPFAKAERSFNATYVNFSGHEVGEKWRYRQTPGLVADALRQLEEELPIDSWFVGGHSQGGFLAYAVALFYPELVDGAFPMSCNLLIQCEPKNFSDETVRAAQREIPFAHIHGTSDTVVEFSSGEYCYEALQDGGFPALRLFTHETAGHRFMFLPVDEAIQWLETMVTSDPKQLLATAKKALRNKEYRDAGHLARKAQRLDKSGKYKSAIAKHLKDLDEKARSRAGELATRMTKSTPDWVDDFWDFRRQFALTDQAQPILATYAKIREEHEAPAGDLFWKARGENDPNKREAIYRELNEKYFASSYYKLVQRFLE